MAAKLSNDELATRVRQRVQRNCSKYRERLAQSGKVQTLVWLPGNIRQQLDAMTNQQQSLSAVTTALLTAALSEPARPAPLNPQEPVDTLPLFDAPAVEAATAVDRDSRILALKREQPELSNYAIAAQIGCSEATARRVINRAKQLESAP